jgi:DNA-binding NtrC family response regulator
MEILTAGEHCKTKEFEERARRFRGKWICASSRPQNRDLRTMVRDGKFREDLICRLAVVEIDLLPLTDQREDLPLLQRYFPLRRNMRNPSRA